MSLVIIQGYTIIASAALPGEGCGTVILGVQSRNVFSDDYSYVVAEVDAFPGKRTQGWPQGDYSHTLDLALQRFNDRVTAGRGDRSVVVSCGHLHWRDGHCANMSCHNYIGKFDSVSADPIVPEGEDNRVRYCTVHETAHHKLSETASCKIEMRLPYRVKGGITYV